MRYPLPSYFRLGSAKPFSGVPTKTKREPRFLFLCHAAFDSGVDFACVLLLIVLSFDVRA